MENTKIYINPYATTDLIVKDSFDEIICGIMYDKFINEPVVTFIGEGKDFGKIFADDNSQIYTVTDDTLSILLMNYCQVMDVVPEFLWKPVARHLAKANV
ncbi:MAG: hypothetical protein U0K86_06855 [Agathobacter sp.]|nr:hypothetical protein [Agathobacter sp.]